MGKVQGEVNRLGVRAIEAERRGVAGISTGGSSLELSSTRARGRRKGGKTDTAPGKGIRTRLHVCALCEDRRQPTRGDADVEIGGELAKTGKPQ